MEYIRSQMNGKKEPIIIDFLSLNDCHCKFPIFDESNFPRYKNVKISQDTNSMNKINLAWNPKWNSMLIISDLHFGNGNASDNFVGKFNEFKEWIESYRPDVVILNGDIFDTWKTTLKESLTYHSEFINYFITSKHPKFLYLRGNHDFLGDTFDFLELEMMDKAKILISHGFQNDPFLYKKLPKLIVKIVSFFEYLQRNAENYPEKILLKWEKWKLKCQDINTDENFISYFTRIFSESAIDSGKYEMVVHGHTHNLPNITHYKSGIIADDGCCQKKARQGILLFKNKEMRIINDSQVDTSY